MADQQDVLPFDKFLQSLHQAQSTQFTAHAQAKVAGDAEFEKMKNHIIKHYEGVRAEHSFKDDNGQIWDCVPIDLQPALARSGKKAAAAPPALPSVQPNEAHESAPAEAQEVYSNAMKCPPGTVPIRRLTLEEMTRFEKLENFFQKGPLGKGRHPRIEAVHPLATPATHKYAHAYQSVNNYGGHSFLSLNQPPIGANQIFSLSQHWYAGGSGAGLQTAEVGWQVYPQKYGNTSPCLFIYWTADGYNKTGCYNHDCGAFVQTNSSWSLGGALGPISVVGGAQYNIEVAFYLYQGNWWLYLNGTAIGYYPTSIYNHGQLATYATEIDYGGEVVGTTSWPPMGSGQWANQAWPRAAFQRNIYYYPNTGGSAWSNLNAAQPSPGCYSLTLGNVSNWGKYFYFGGPGGTGC